MKEEYSGVPAMLRSALWLDLTCGLQVLSIGRVSGLERADCVMELNGSQLLVRVSLMGGWVWLSAVGLDEGEQPQPICNFGDTPEGWRDVCKLVQALERSGITSLKERPIHIGEGGTPDSYVIDY
jgi:hypothetical protein